MNIKQKKLFELLEIEPNEKFTVSGLSSWEDGTIYHITEECKLMGLTLRDNKWTERSYYLGTLLNNVLIEGCLQIIKIRTPSEKDLIAMKYAKVNGFNWLATNVNNICYAFINKPHKARYNWTYTVLPNDSLYIHCDFPLWKDEEPIFIDDWLNETKEAKDTSNEIP